MIQSFKSTIAKLLDGVTMSDIYDVIATSSGNVRRRRRSLLAGGSSVVSYKVRTTSKGSAEKIKEDVVNMDSASMTDTLKQEMVLNDVAGISTDNLKA